MTLDKMLSQKANLARKWCLESTTAAGSGHPTSCLSAADLTTVLFDSYFSYDLKNPLNPNNDRIIFSKGHAAPLFYTLFALAGAFDPKELLTLRKYKSILEGHPTPEFKYTDAATGSLGQGLSVGCGIAYSVQSSKFKVQSLPKTYVLLGDGEMAEGSVWEAANFASYYKLNNLIAILDVNRFGQSQETMFGHQVEEYSTKFSAFDWEVLIIDGHNLKEIDKAFELATNNKSDKPFVIIAKTKKGKGISMLEDKDGWHGKPLKKEDLEMALKELGEIDESLRFKLKSPKKVILANKVRPESVQQADPGQARMTGNINYKIGDQVATREVYGEVLAQLGSQNELIYSLDGDVKNSTYSMDFKKVHPDRFIECFIAEQNMVGVALGLQRLGKIPFVSTFSAFLTRAFDQIRMSGISKANIKFVGSHSGVSIGEDGSSQMGLEDIAMFATLPETVVLHPSDGVSTAKLLPQLVSHKGISYLRTLRPKTPVIYDSKETFEIGGSKILKQSDKDVVTIAATGITVHEALKAYETLKKENIFVRVIDCYSLKPIDKDTLIESTRTTEKNTIIAVEDHFEHGGLGDLVQTAVSGTGACVVKLAVDHFSRSGSSAELLKDAGIDAASIVNAVKECND